MIIEQYFYLLGGRLNLVHTLLVHHFPSLQRPIRFYSFLKNEYPYRLHLVLRLLTFPIRFRGLPALEQFRDFCAPRALSTLVYFQRSAVCEWVKVSQTLQKPICFYLFPHLSKP